ncbi:MotA/TolQ/ExbB proton channel family protein [Dichotomicrobium thermohalophilum]|uniref:Cell division and transport-associated protein TolQ n=1 Tax=Dichotomicrobium thermohalophilum TaxID=933063 RepID=A0A397Q1T6_9HYPH|nr:MotA/TolQ/ExbB proton channel family protein [Dichotomicrobium thermohalophilum]RIA55460.1 cell division and transport-associated protein TolQ [Dichotomicrobium thermohalophilum]
MESQSPASLFLAAPADVSVFALFGEAGLVVQAVVLVLVAALIWTLVAAASKYTELTRVRQEADAFERLFWSGPSLDELYASMNGKRTGSLSAIFMAAMYEWRRTLDTSPRAVPGVQGRMERLMAVSIARETDRLEWGLTALGMISAAAPLLGLAGALWALMAGFTTSENFAGLAPAAARGLLAAALGLFVGVVAVIFHRGLKRAVRRHEQRMKDFAQEFSAIVSRQIDASI